MHSLTTIVAPLWDERVAETEALIDKLGNPARADIRARLESLDRHEGFHFMSLHAPPAGDNPQGHIILEFTADAEEESGSAGAGIAGHDSSVPTIARGDRGRLNGAGLRLRGGISRKRGVNPAPEPADPARGSKRNRVQRGEEDSG